MINIRELIGDKSRLNAETLPRLKELVDSYPFFQAARLLYIANLYILHSPDFGKELRKASIFVPDRTALFTLTEATSYELPNENTPKISIETEGDADRTSSIIDDFLNKEEENATPSIADLTNDYASFLLKQDDITTEEMGEEENQEAETVGLRGEELINSFIEETTGKQRFEFPDINESDFVSPVISDEDEEIYTERMVNIYIKQGRYQQALEILRKICLNNPKKSANFAAQINLLEIIIGENK